MSHRLLASFLAAVSFAGGSGAQGTPPTAEELVERDRLARLAAIAVELQDPAVDGVSLLTEAVRACGFVVWDENRSVLAEPTGAPRLFLALTDAEIRGAVEMFRAGQTVARDDLLAGIDVLYRTIGTDKSVAPHALAWFRDGFDTGNASVRALACFLGDLGAHRGQRLDHADGCVLDAIQALCVLRVLTEDIGTPLRRAIARGELDDGGTAPGTEPGRRRGPFAEPGAPAADGPGWAEDAYVGGITGLFAEAVGEVTKFRKAIKDGTGKANAIATIAKFVLTYTFLKGRVWDDDPDNPLIRTKDTDPGAQCTLYAAFWIDGTRVTDWLKDHRLLAATAGLDLDMPRSGPLKGIETEWDIRQDRHSSKYHLIQTVRGQPDISRIRTDDQGEAKIRVEGCPQPRKLDPMNVLPVEKVVRIVVTPQVKSTEMQQDLVDAVLGAIGISGGGVGFLTPVIECLYRMKWNGGQVYDLQVRDWVPAETIGQASIELRASGSWFRGPLVYRMSLDRKLVLTDVHMDVMGFDPMPMPDPSLRKLMGETAWKQMEEGMRQANEMAKLRTFTAKAPGQLQVHVHDSLFSRSEPDGCGDELQELRMTWDGERSGDYQGPYAEWPAMFMAQCNLEQKTVELQLDAAVLGRVVQTARSGRQAATTTESEEALTPLGGLRLAPPFDGGKIVMPLQESPTASPGVVAYYGVATVPFTFGRGFRGNAIVSWSVQRRLPPK